MLRVSALALITLTAVAQTTLDLPSQTRRVDFTQAASTRPVKAGTTLPSTCVQGDLYFLTGATAGQNLYACASANTWSALSVLGVYNDGALVATRPKLNFVTGTGFITAVTDLGTQVNVQIGLDSASIQTPTALQAGTPLRCTSSTASGVTYACSLSPMLRLYSTGTILNWVPDATNTGAATLNVDQLGAVAVKKWDGTTALTAGDVVAGELYPVWYDGTVFRLMFNPAAGTSASAITSGTLANAQLSDAIRMQPYSIAIGGTGSVIAAAENKGYVVVGAACAIGGWALTAEPAGSIAIEIDRSNAGIPAVTTNSITASANPSLSSAQYRSGTCPADCTGWTTALAANDVLGFYVTSASTVTRATLTLFCKQ
jgi:hypothetical protein